MSKKTTKKELFAKLDEILTTLSQIHSANLGEGFPMQHGSFTLSKEDFIDKRIDKIKDSISDIKMSFTFDVEDE